MDSGFIKDNVPTSKRNSENHILQHNTVHNNNNNNNHVLLARYASDLLHNYITLVN